MKNLRMRCLFGKRGMNLKLKKMKLTLLFSFLIFSSVWAETYSQTTKLNLNLKNATVQNFIKEIEDQTGYLFLYQDEVINRNQRITIEANNETLENVLKIFEKQVSVVAEITENQIVLKKAPETLRKPAQQPDRTITGLVTEQSGEPLPGVSVVVKGTTVGTVTNADGQFSLVLPSNAETLVFSFVGMRAQEIPIGNRTTISIIMEEETIGMEEVVVVGYGTQKKANLTGAVDQVTSEVFENRTMTNVTQGLKGVIPNLNITLLDGRPNQAPAYNIRGTTSIGQGGDALVLIDGVEGDPSLINPNDIESISVLKDAASASIYGARGAFGVVLITTKNPTREKTSITYNTNFSIKNPVVLPDYVWDGYTWAKMFNQAHYNWEGSYPSAANKTIRFSQEYLEEFKYRSENPDEFTEKWEINPANGEYVYYYSTNWYDELYKKYTTSNEHNVTVSGSSATTNYMITGRYLGQKGLFRYNSDDYEMLNFRGKGSVQVFPWLNFRCR